MANAEAVVREMIDAINRDDMTRYRDILHKDYSYRGPDGEIARGQDAGVAIVQTYRAAFPDDMALDVQHVHVAGNTAIVEVVGRGTHNGDLMGVPASGRKAEVPIVTVLEIRDGKIHTEREYFDTATLMQQIGVTLAPATA